MPERSSEWVEVSVRKMVKTQIIDDRVRIFGQDGEEYTRGDFTYPPEYDDLKFWAGLENGKKPLTLGW